MCISWMFNIIAKRYKFKKYNTTKDELLAQIGGIDALKYELEMQKVIEILKK